MPSEIEKSMNDKIARLKESYLEAKKKYPGEELVFVRGWDFAIDHNEETGEIRILNSVPDRWRPKSKKEPERHTLAWLADPVFKCPWKGPARWISLPDGTTEPYDENRRYGVIKDVPASDVRRRLDVLEPSKNHQQVARSDRK